MHVHLCVLRACHKAHFLLLQEQVLSPLMGQSSFSMEMIFIKTKQLYY
jgi:hypothetical protein